LSAIYSGEGAFASSNSGNQFFDVVKPEPTVTTLSILASSADAPATLTAIAAAQDSFSPTSNGTVTFSGPGGPVGAPVPLDGAGRATLTVPAPLDVMVMGSVDP
jgi:hypothetical protein